MNDEMKAFMLNLAEENNISCREMIRDALGLYAAVTTRIKKGERPAMTKDGRIVSYFTGFKGRTLYKP